MAQTITAKGTAVSKTSGTTLTTSSISILGGQTLVIGVGFDSSVSANPTSVKFGTVTANLVKQTTIGTSWRLCTYERRILNTKTRDCVVTWPTANTTKVMTVSVTTEAGDYNLTGDGIHLAGTVSIAGNALAIDHIKTLHIAHHLTNGPSSDASGTSSTGHTLGQRTGTTGDADTTNLTIQERYKIITATTVAAGSFTATEDYQIKTIGATDFTLIGAASNTVGLIFTATGVGTGTGDAYHMETARSRVTGLATRDHCASMAFYIPAHTFTVKEMVQHHRNMNHNPDWVEVKIEDENGDGFWFNIDPDDFDDWSDAVVTELLTKRSATWLANNIDSNLTYEEDTTRNTRMATFINDTIDL